MKERATGESLFTSDPNREEDGRPYGNPSKNKMRSGSLS
jgi:hypothetical protein